MLDKRHDWFTKSQVASDLTMLLEPYVDDFFRANIWHLKGRDRDLVIDTGMGLANLTARLDLTPGKPVLAIATHAHVDHVGSLHEFAERAGPKVEAHAFECMEDRYTYADLYRQREEPVSEAPEPGWSVERYRPRPAPLTWQLSEGDIVETGDRQFRVLHLPGHSPGSIGLLDEKNGVFFSGDAIYDDILLDDLPDSDPVSYQATMARIMELPVHIVHPGHCGSFGADRMRKIARDYLLAKEQDPLIAARL